MSSTIHKTFTTAGLLALFVAITPSVRGHGYVQYVYEGSNTYQGFQDDWYKPDGSPIMITDYLIPSYNVDSSVIACGINPKASQSLAQVSPGSTLNINWVTHGDTTDQPQKHWTHNEGTHRAFIGACIGDCSTTDPTQVEWTELPAQNVGNWQTWNGQNWPVSVLAAGNTWSVSIPDVATGDYLLRDELTALHFSDQLYQDYDSSIQHGEGTEFYPTCMAIHVNNGGGSFDTSTVMKFPGAYTVNEPGHYNPNLWTDPSSVILAATNSYTRSGAANPPNSGSSTSGSSGSSSSSGTSGGGSSNSSSGPAPSSGPSCSANRRKRSAKFHRRHHHARSH